MQNRNPGLHPDLKSGHPSLELTNTVNNHASAQPGETLFNYGDLLAWAKQIGLLNAEQVDLLAQKAARQPGRAAIVFRKSLELREALYRIFVAKIQDKTPVQEDLTILNSVLSEITNSAQVVHDAGKFEWQWNFDQNALDVPLWLSALSAADLMTSDYYQWIGQCADEDGCGWLFVDTSKNHSRRWCDINDCGNRAKQRRYQKRAQKQKT